MTSLVHIEMDPECSLPSHWSDQTLSLSKINDMVPVNGVICSEDNPHVASSVSSISFSRILGRLTVPFLRNQSSGGLRQFTATAKEFAESAGVQKLKINSVDNTCSINSQISGETPR